ncbi:glycine-rich cell wall structural protein-like [Hibiscus syriacus]|uniref:glycine-rich cell wall structural protein-like n=1 Tax=Hibiscus syriacus TaxID=106335 RepID=UPI001921876D|nr:glycine-rich cell wall structural protein-like [Hibiscus syriacus]
MEHVLRLRSYMSNLSIDNLLVVQRRVGRENSGDLHVRSFDSRRRKQQLHQDVSESMVGLNVSESWPLGGVAGIAQCRRFEKDNFGGGLTGGAGRGLGVPRGGCFGHGGFPFFGGGGFLCGEPGGGAGRGLGGGFGVSFGGAHGDNLGGEAVVGGGIGGGF